MTKPKSNDQYKVVLDLGLELVFEDASRVQPNEATVEAGEGKDGEPVALGYRLVGVNVLQESYRAEVAPLATSAGWASVTRLSFKDFGESFEVA